MALVEDSLAFDDFLGPDDLVALREVPPHEDVGLLQIILAPVGRIPRDADDAVFAVLIDVPRVVVHSAT